MTLLAPWGLLAGLLVIPIVAMHILRPHRDRQPVSSTYLWRSLEEPIAASQPWQRLRWSVPLVLQLLIVMLLALALAQPARMEETELAEHTVFIVDASGSMLSTDELPNRLDAAKERVAALRGQIPDGGSATLVVANASPEVLVIDSTDRELFDRELDRIRPTAGVADFDQAFTLAEASASALRETGWVLVSDGGVTTDQQRLAPAGTRYESVGSLDVNRAIVALTVGVDDGDLSAIVSIANTGGPSATQQLRVDVDGVTVTTETVELAPGATTELSVPIPPGSRVEAFLDGDDLLENDNQRAALAPIATDLRVRVASSDPDGAFFVEEVLTAMGAELVLDPRAGVDLIIYDGVAAPTTPEVPYISIASPTPPPGVTILGSVDRPVPTFLADDVLLDDVDITRTAIATAQMLDLDAGRVLIGGAEGEPLLIEGRTGTTGWYHLAFDLEQSNLPVSVAYPILFSRMVSSLTISDDVPASARVGERLPVLPSDAIVTSPRGVSTEVPTGGRMPVLDRTGFWTVEDADGLLRPVAVVFPASESRIAVPDALDELTVASAETPIPGAGNTTTSIGLFPWVLMLGLIVVVVEFLVTRRRIGVPHGQWWASMALRSVVVVCLVAALIGIEIDRTDNSVRVVLVVDVSDSLGPDGRSEVEDFVAAAESAGDMVDLAIVEVGSTVRVSKPFGDRNADPVDAPSGDGSDLVRGIRLASSLLDGSTRERIVLISDGRNTAGDLAAEVDRLSELDVTLDARSIRPAARRDVAVQSVSAPGRVSEQESYTLLATVIAEEPTPAVVELLRNGELEATQAVDLSVGENDVEFVVTSMSVGLDRFSVRLAGASDAVPQNDEAFAAVATEGPPQVLIIDGDVDSGAQIEQALAARAVDVQRRSMDSFPAMDELATFSTVVLVDVEERALGDEHLDALGTFVRDQGRGLLVIGGRQSFAVGGYAESSLEDLLPVESRAEDPTRKATVAEVLLIDASESMGACHCAPSPEDGDVFGGEPVEGGVNKTDISKAAAAQAIGALSANDEVGVLAFSGSSEWILPLQSVPSDETVRDSLGRLTPTGETRIGPALRTAAEGLRESDKELKHIILFSDGFSPELFGGEFDEFGNPVNTGESELADQAAELAAEGITISVVATGEGAAPLLEQVAIEGNGRFYPGRDLDEIPEIFVEEARIASRSFINEGAFVPAVTSTADSVRNLEAAPPISGYLASTAKDTTDVMLQVGEFADPLLSSWRVGLGRVTAWTSDGGDRWASGWAGWPGWADFWSTVVRETFPLEGADGQSVRADVRGDSLFVELVSESALPSSAAPVAQVSTPGGDLIEVELARTSETTFAASVPAMDVGSYSVGVSAAGDNAEVVPIATGVANRSYQLEYRPAAGPQPDLAGLSNRTGGRGEVLPTQVFDADGLTAGSSAWALRWWLVLAATLLWPLVVALSRVRWSTLWSDWQRSRGDRLRA